MKSKENTPKTLHLVLKSKWFDKIASGEKTSEYREIKPYWNKRFMPEQDFYAGYDPVAFDYCMSGKYKTVVFHRGYTSKTMEFKIDYICIAHEPNDLNLEDCWEIKLGQRITKGGDNE